MFWGKIISARIRRCSPGISAFSILLREILNEYRSIRIYRELRLTTSRRTGIWPYELARSLYDQQSHLVCARTHGVSVIFTELSEGISTVTLFGPGWIAQGFLLQIFCIHIYLRDVG